MRRRGATLVEVIVYCALLGLLLTAIYQVLIGCARAYVEYLSVTELERGVMIATTRVTWELAESNSGSIRIDTNPSGIVFASPQNAQGLFQYDASGNLLWQKYVCYYLDTATRKLVRKEEYLTTPETSAPAIPTGKTTSYFKNSTSLVSTWSAPAITTFTPSGASPVSLTIAASAQSPIPDKTGTRPADNVEIFTRVYLRN